MYKRKLKKYLSHLKGGNFLNSPTIFTEFRSVKQENNGLFYSKPEGIWYSVGNDWFNHLLKIGCIKIEQFIYKIEINYSNIYTIKTEEEIDSFTELYGRSVFGNNKDDTIDWELLSKGYTGVEICPYIYSRRKSYRWYYTWDCASGCIWDKSAIFDVKLVVDFEN